MADARALWSACAQTLNSYCDAACPLFRTHGALVAAVGGSRLSKTERAWRCYANAALDERGDYHGGAEYCTRHAVLSAMAEECATSSEPRVAAAVSASAAGAAVAVDVSPLTPWPLADVKEVTIPAVDATTWQATRDAELMRVHAWSVPCIDSLAQHTLNNRTRNVSRRKAFLSRAGLACYGTCVRGVVDGFATPTELAPLLAIAPVPMPGVPSNILSWRWEVPSEPPIFRTLVARAHAVLTERFGVSNLRFYRSNMITWLAGRCVGGKAECAEWPATPRPWQPSSLHGDTNTDEMFIYTTILYLAQHGVDVAGGETGLADVVVDEAAYPGRAEKAEFVTAGLRVQPAVGRLLVFSSGVENMHEMLPVTHGRRVAIQMWFACDGMDPGWAHEQRIAWAAEHGFGGPDRDPSFKAPPKQPLTKPWAWR